MKCVSQCTNGVLRFFYSYGHKVGQLPIPFMLICVIVCGIFAAGLAKIDPLTDMEEQYLPEGSQAFENRKELSATFPDLTGSQFSSFSLPRDTPRISFIFRSHEGENVLNQTILHEIKKFLDNSIINVNVRWQGMVYNYSDLCARRDTECVQSGNLIFTQEFREELDAGRITYPVSQSNFPNEDLGLNIGRPNLNESVFNLPVLLGAGSLFITYPLRTDGVNSASKAWEDKVIDLMPEILENSTLPLYIAYSSSKSLNEELDKSTAGDIIFFILTFTLMITYASIVSSGGNMVSTRALLSSGGVLATCLGIVGSFGLVILCGVRYVNMAGIMPFLLLGVGVDDMFLLMSAWSETTDHPELTVPQRVGTVFKKAGIGITITSVTNCLSFAIGASSVFQSVRNFCIFTGVGVVMCYLANITFFGGCLALHGKRVYSNRHTLTCKKVKSQAELEAEGRSPWYGKLCGGETPDKAMADQSVCERGPSYALPRFIMWRPVRISVIVIFVANLGIAIWGCTVLEQGLDLKDLVLSSSYVHKFENWHKEDFGLKLPISFVKTGPLDYRSPETVKEMTNLINKAKEDSWISNQIDVCWLTTYVQIPFIYNSSTDEAFIAGLKRFLDFQPRFKNDVVIKNVSIVASRCYVYSNSIVDSHEQAQLMVRMRDLAEDSPVVDFAFHWAFIFFEQFVLILPTTMQTVGITIAVMGVVTAFFLPHPVIVILVMTQVLMIVTCIFGYMALWGLTLSSITMVHLIMSAGLSVDFCAHVCTAYMVSEKQTRQDRAKDAIVHASGPILNGGTSSMVGILGLLFSESFIFQSFFKVMLLVIGFGVAHAVFFVPVLLSFVGPRNFVKSSEEESADSVHANGHGKVSPHTEIDLDTEKRTNAKGHHSYENNGIELNNIENNNNRHKPQNGNGAQGNFVSIIDVTGFEVAPEINGNDASAVEDEKTTDKSGKNTTNEIIEHQYTNEGFTTGDEQSNNASPRPEDNNRVENVQENNIEHKREQNNVDNSELNTRM